MRVCQKMLSRCSTLSSCSSHEVQKRFDQARADLNEAQLSLGAPLSMRKLLIVTQCRAK